MVEWLRTYEYTRQDGSEVRRRRGLRRPPLGSPQKELRTRWFGCWQIVSRVLLARGGSRSLDAFCFSFSARRVPERRTTLATVARHSSHPTVQSACPVFKGRSPSSSHRALAGSPLSQPLTRSFSASLPRSHLCSSFRAGAAARREKSGFAALRHVRRSCSVPRQSSHRVDELTAHMLSHSSIAQNIVQKGLDRSLRSIDVPHVGEREERERPGDLLNEQQRRASCSDSARWHRHMFSIDLHLLNAEYRLFYHLHRPRSHRQRIYNEHGCSSISARRRLD